MANVRSRCCEIFGGHEHDEEQAAQHIPGSSAQWIFTNRERESEREADRQAGRQRSSEAER
jgi:hypothetical protein